MFETLLSLFRTKQIDESKLDIAVKKKLISEEDKQKILNLK